MTKYPVDITSGTATLDFTDTSFASYGTFSQVEEDGVYCMWAGNCNNDLLLKYAGVDNDRDVILTRIGSIVPTNVIEGYFLEDSNLDGKVKYAGFQNDRDLILINIGAIVTSVRFEQLP